MTTRMPAAALRWTVAVAVLIGLVALIAPLEARAEEPEESRLLLMLDASGSMKAADPSGLTKMEAAKRALVSVVDSLPADSTVGLRVYGAVQPGGRPTKAACTDTQLVHPVASLDRPGLKAAISRFQPKGETPIAYSLQQGLKDLGPEGKRHIVLVSDGEESCVPDPCPSVRELVAGGVDLQIDTVGFGVDAKARTQLQCIAQAGRGSYYDARTAAALTASLNKLSQRALRPFTVSGTPVRASEAPEDAPTLAPGQYVDSFAGNAPARYYRLVRAEGATVRLSVSHRPPDRGEDYNREDLWLRVSTPEGRECEAERGYRFDPGGRSEAVVAHVRLRPPTSAEDGDPCRTGTEFVVAVNRDKGGSAAQPVEVLVIEEPPATNLTSLPPPLATADVKPLIAPASGQGGTVVGGGSFSDALTLTPGTYTDTILPAEQIFYRVRVDFGQRAAFTVDVPAPGQRLALGATSYTAFAVDAYGPSRYHFPRPGGEPRNRGSLGPTGQSLVLGEYIPQIRYRNREAEGARGYSYVTLREASVAGDHYFAISRSAEKAGEDSAAPVMVRIRVAVDGQPSGQPEYAGGSGQPPAASTTTPTSTQTGDDSGAAPAPRAEGGPEKGSDGPSVPVMVAGGLALAGTAAAVAYAAWSGRRRPSG
jgi:Ca-activated chloride channel family protein